MQVHIHPPRNLPDLVPKFNKECVRRSADLQVGVMIRARNSPAWLRARKEGRSDGAVQMRLKLI
jgi:hypothetical protein